MNAALAAGLVTIPRPSDATDTCVTLDPDGWRIAWWREGRIEEPFGPPFDKVREACAASQLVRQAHGLA